jgi:hypothetical protein
MAKKKTEVTMVSVAKLDENSIYQGIELINQKNLTKEHVEVPGDCDLKIGKYYWDTDKQTFMPTSEFIKEVIAQKETANKRKGG